jgi:hypothetical protein
MTDDRLRSLYGELLQEHRGEERAACVSSERLFALAEGKLSETDALAAADHVMACGHCRNEFALVRALLKARPDAQRNVRGRLALAASVVLVVATAAVWEVVRERNASMERGGAESVQLVRADLRAGAPVTLLWRGVPGATRFVVELMDSVGRTLHQETTRDTLLVLPETVRLASGQTHRWWVRAILADGREVRSSIDTFRAP